MKLSDELLKELRKQALKAWKVQQQLGLIFLLFSKETGKSAPLDRERPSFFGV